MIYTKQLQTKKINRGLLAVLFLASIFLLVSIFIPASVHAGGTPDGEGNVVAALCYVPPDKATFVGIESEQEACRNFGGQIVQPNDPSPLTFCYLGSEIRVTDSCSDGALIRRGEPVPAVLKADPNESAARGDNSSENALPTITNAERDELVNCSEGPQRCLDKNPIISLTRTAINFLAAGVGVVVTAMIIIGGIQYSSAGGNPQAVQAAKKKIANAIIALLAYFFLYAFLQWLIPGGLL